MRLVVDGGLVLSLLLLISRVLSLDAVRSLSDGANLPDAAVDLNSTDFNSFLDEARVSFAIVEFFAHWCPACRNYKPHYEKVAKLFNGPGALYPGIILMVRIDCAFKINTNLCHRFSVNRYPMLLWGPPDKFVDSVWNPEQTNNEIQSIDNGRTADLLLGWINKKINSSFSFDDGKYENESLLAKNALYREQQIAQAIYDVEEATAVAFEIIMQHQMIKLSNQAALIKFLQLLVTHHPSKRCRRGIAEILVSFDDLWPPVPLSVSSEESPVLKEEDILKSYPICGKDIPRHYWTFCRGSKNETRGFSCGLWVLFHSLSVRIRDGESQLLFAAICDFVQNFFVCDDCRRHFHEMSSRVSEPFNSSQALSIWLWRAHNKVNERLMKEEKDMGTSDPMFPKVMWPPKQLCSSCYVYSIRTYSGNKEIDWNEDEVYKFMVTFYGRSLVYSYEGVTPSSSKKEESDGIASLTSAVPIGAALAIAPASCVFGALACFWRAWQKRRKYSHQLHPLKEI